MNAIVSLSDGIMGIIGNAIMDSLWQGFIVFLLIKILFLGIPNLKSSLKFNIAYWGLFAIFALFGYGLISGGVEYVHINGSAYIIANFINQPESDEASNAFIPHLPITLNNITPYLSIAYFVGLIFLSIKMLVQFIGIKRLRHGNRMPDEQFQKLLQDLKLKMNITKRVVLQFSHKINTPMLFGYIKPVILLPVALVLQLDSKHLEVIISHELAHLKRNDYLWNVLHIVIKNLLFFNPAIWFLSSIIKNEREYACDDLVLSIDNEPKIYAQALLAVSTFQAVVNPVALPFSENTNKHILLTRIKRMTMKKNNKNAQSSLVSVFYSIILVVFLGAFTVYGQKAFHEKSHSETEVPDAPIEVPDDNDLADTMNIPQVQPMQKSDETDGIEKSTSGNNPKSTLQKGQTDSSIDFEQIIHDAAKPSKNLGKSIQEAANDLQESADMEVSLKMKEMRLAMIEMQKEQSLQIQEMQKQLKEQNIPIPMQIDKTFDASYWDSMRSMAKSIRKDSEIKRQELDKKRSEVYASRDQLQKEMAEKRAEIEVLRKEMVEKSKQVTEANKLRLNEIEKILHREKVIKNTKKYNLRYKNGTLFINGKRQPKEIKEQVLPYLNGEDIYIRRN